MLFGNKFPNMLTKEQVLERAGGEENLIRHLVPTFNPKLRKKNYKSIFSLKDDRPSMSIYKDAGIWKFKSFNTGHQGDVFRMWADYYGLDCQTQFKELLQLINREMLLGLENDSVQYFSSFKPIISKDSTDIGENRGSLPSQTLHIEYVPYGNSDISRLYLRYWSQYDISQSVLDYFNVKQVGFLSYTSNSSRFLSFKYREKNQIAAAYNVSGRVKVYVPEINSSFSSDLFFKGQKKSFSYKNQTKEDVFGLEQLGKGTLDYILLTAGEKDCMSAYAHGFSHVISLQSEHQMPSASLLETLRNSTSIILSCYDNDVAGINASKRLEASFGIVSIPLPKDIKDIADYFRSYSSNDFQALLYSAIQKALSLPLQKYYNTADRKVSNSLRSKVEQYLRDKFSFRLNVVTQQCEILVKSKYDIWEQVNVSELRGHLDRHGISCSLDVIKCILRSFFVKQFHPIQSYFLSFEECQLDDSIDYILELSSYVKLKNATCSHGIYWYNHLKKWMIRAVRTVFERDGINKHALILCSPKENIGKSYFCEFLCPSSLISYYNGNPIISNEKDAQKSLIRNFIINLDELHHFRSNAHVIKAWLSQRYVNIRLPYQEDEITEARIASFVGSTNDVAFLHSDLGHSRWICFEIAGTRCLDENAQSILEKAWHQAYNLYKFDGKSGELTRKELEEILDHSDHFTTRTAESELITQYLTPSTKKCGSFMTTTCILKFLQEHIGTSVRLNTKLVGSALRELGFDRIKQRTHKGSLYGYFVEMCDS